MRQLHATQTSLAPHDGSLIGAARELLTAWRRRRRFSRLRNLDDHVLLDIGLTRDEIDWGSSLPLGQDAVERIMRCRAARRPR